MLKVGEETSSCKSKRAANARTRAVLPNPRSPYSKKTPPFGNDSFRYSAIVGSSPSFFAANTFFMPLNLIGDGYNFFKRLVRFGAF